MKKNFSILVLTFLFSQGLLAQFTRQDSTYIAKSIQRGDSLFDRQLYLESSDQYVLGISHATHIFGKNSLLPYQKKSLELFYEELSTKIARNTDLIKPLNADSLQYERCIKLGQGHLVKNDNELASLEFKNALHHKPQDSLASTLLKSALAITSDTLSVTRTKANYLILDPYYQAINFYTPHGDLVYKASDTSLYSGVINVVEFDIPTNSIAFTYNTYSEGHIVKSQKFLCPTNMPLKSLTYDIIDSLFNIPRNDKCRLIEHSRYLFT